MKKFIIFILIVILFPITVNADDTIQFSCQQDSAEPGDSVTCSIIGSTNLPIINFFEAKISLGDGLSITSDSLDTSDWDESGMSDVTNTGIDIIGRTTNKMFTVAQFSIAVAADATVGDKTITINEAKWGCNEDNNTENIVCKETNNLNEVSETIRVNASETPPTPKGLSNLEITGTGVTFGQQFSTTNYGPYMVTLSSSTTTFKIKATPANSSENATIKNTDSNETYTNNSDITFTTPSGQNSMSITITTGSGDSATSYTILINREAAQTTSGPTLKQLVIGGQNIGLRNDNSGSEEVNVTVANINNYQIKAVLNDATNYSFKSNGLNGCSISGDTMTCNLNSASRVIIQVEPKTSGGSSKSYILNINKRQTTPENPPSQGQNISQNPRTGIASTTMAMVLITSLLASLYLYRQNMKSYN